ncbi:MFS transporter [Cryomorpha ignava]|uniref:MFS transporter n=1 Tax=Cryomorpha ignava TaxID=101383 RepID=A0A7K3WM87_9FLAO|nr:MFS transporter [Cryomorpha ignava]NEN22759.1 MFS transporter [Cryomorpha ignava]
MKASQPKTRQHLSLTDNALTRYFTFSALYIAQGIPEGITFFAIPAWMAMNGKSPMEIAAFVAVIGIPWSFKILIAPLMDRFTLLNMGRKRPWVIFGQLGLIISFLSLGLVSDPLYNSFGLMTAGFFISFFGAFQDVATDGMAVDVIPETEQAKANGLMWGTKVIGTSASFVIGTWLINTVGFSIAVSSLSVAVAAIMFFPIYFRERPGEKLMPWTPGEAAPDSKQTQLRSWKHIFKSLYKVIRLKSSVVFGIGVFAIGIMFGLMEVHLPLFTIQELGWTNTFFSQVLSISMVAGGLLGMIVGGYLVDYFGKIKMLTLYLGILTILISAFASMSSLWSNNIVVYIFLMSYFALYTFLCIAVFASAMHLCWKTVAATQFTLYMAANNMGRSAGAALMGVLKTNFSWEFIFVCIALIPVFMAILMQFVNFKKHRVRVDSFVLLNQTLVAPRVIKE